MQKSSQRGAETERFIPLIQRDKFDYTEWRQQLFAGLSGEEISRREFQKMQQGKNLQSEKA